MPQSGTNDGFVQVAVDSTGKKVVMFQGVDSTGATVYVQAAQLVGDVPDLLWQIKNLMQELLATNRTMLEILSSVSNSRADEDTYYGRDSTED